MQELRAAIEDRLRQPPPFPQGRFTGRGIVTCAGGHRYFTCVWVLIWVLRRVHGSQLPIQVWHLGRAEMSDAMRLLLEEQDVEVVDAETVLHSYPATIGGGWPLKPYAIAHSRFRQVLFLDADTVPLIDPASILDWELYRQSGLLFWPDIIDVRKTNPIWASLGLAPRGCISIDSGIIAIDKERHWDLLDLAILFNEHWRDTYRCLHGDKDTFLLASLLTGDRHATVSHRPFNFSDDLVQRDLDGEPLLHHRTASKWRLLGSNRPMVHADLSHHCEEALAELRRRWTGVIFHAPDRSQRARSKEAELIALRRFRYEPDNKKARALELLAAGAIGEGRTELEQHWAVIERDDVLALQFYSGSRLVVELQLQPDESWRGESIGHPGFEARLVAEQEGRTWPHADQGRLRRSAEAEIAAMLDPVLFAAGFDREAEQELRAALSLLNRLFDDVPEQVEAKLATLKLPPIWRGALAALPQALQEARDKRISRSNRDLVVPVDINPDHYSRVF